MTRELLNSVNDELRVQVYSRIVGIKSRKVKSVTSIIPRACVVVPFLFRVNDTAYGACRVRPV